MQFSITREALLKPLQFTAGVVDRKQTMSVLSNLLFVVADGRLAVTATDLEIEMVAYTTVIDGDEGAVTLPARKFADICRMLPEGAKIHITTEGERAVVKSGRSRFVLGTLPAEDYPNLELATQGVECKISPTVLRKLIEQTQFAMAQQDVRYYLNGLLLEVQSGIVRAVATDGHRLALCEIKEDIKIKENQQVIVPRKGVLELLKLLGDNDEPVSLQLTSNHIRVSTKELTFTSKLIDGRFPDYQRVVPQGGDKIVVAERELLRQALGRISILCNERYRSVKFQLEPGVMRVLATNPEQEEAEEEVTVDYNGAQLEIGFNASYVLEALSAIKENDVKMILTDANSCCLIRGLSDDSSKYVVMPMRL